MKHCLRIPPRLLALLVICLLTLATSTAQADVSAKAILDATGVQGGIIVHLGCGGGRLTAGLRATDAFVVHGLALNASPALVAEARRFVRSQGVYGPVSIEQFSGHTLPYVDNLINLVVVQEQGDVSMDEILRVLAPGGVACLDRDGTLEIAVKPRPSDIDDWGHFLHDASGNAVAHDTVVGPPRNLQWIAPPLWLRSHETPSGIQSPVSADGRLIYFFDEGPIGITDERLPSRWAMICRDAFNGKLLWRRPLGGWGWRQWSLQRYQGKDWTKLRSARTDVPNENHRRIVAVDDRIYTTLSHGGSMSILQAATGELIKNVDATLGAREILVAEGVAVVYVRELPEDIAARRGMENAAGAALVGVDARTGKPLWRHESGPIRSLALAIDNGRVVYLAGRKLVGLDLTSGQTLWTVTAAQPAPRTLLVVNEVVVMQGGKLTVAHDATNGELLWRQTGPSIGGGEGDDLFVVDGLVWRGMAYADEAGAPSGKSPNVVVIGWDLRSGEEKRRIHVNNLRSPEHHHRCYRNKATTRYLISSYEGAEYLDFQGDDHSQSNFVRGVCRHGMLPCNGMLYVPADQCFCQPGAKLLGYAALTAAPEVPLAEVADADRLEKGPAYGKAAEPESPSADNWPTFRHDAARSGATSAQVEGKVAVAWKTQLAGRLTAPVACDNRLFVAEIDAHTVHALDATTGQSVWSFTAAGRVDSPPTIHDGMVLFGSSDGRVYCLRASDGQLVWRFLAAPSDRRVGHFDQIESAWPVHGSVLLVDGTVYFSAGRSTYLDGGIRLWGLDPASGSIRHKGLLEGPHRSVDKDRDMAFFLTGANSDVLVAEGGFLYMRQKKMTLELDEIDVEVLSSKGAQDVGLHIFSTSGLLDGSWYNRTFWMYSQRWPGFQLANQAPKTGQLLVVDQEKTYAVRVFYRRNVHSPMFYQGKEGYLLFADYNTNEPQLVGEEGSRKPIRWLPQSDYPRGRGDEVRALESEAFGLDKMIGYTRAEPAVWTQWLPVRIRGMVKAGDNLFVAGAPDIFDPDDPFAALEGRRGASLVAVSGDDGEKLSEVALDYPPVFDGLIAAGGRLFISLTDGSVVCLAGK